MAQNEVFWAAAGVVVASLTLIGAVLAVVYKFRGELDKKMSFEQHDKICVLRDARLEKKLDELGETIKSNDQETKEHRSKMYEDIGAMTSSVSAVSGDIAVLQTRVDFIAANTSVNPRRKTRQLKRPTRRARG